MSKRHGDDICTIPEKISFVFEKTTPLDVKIKTEDEIYNEFMDTKKLSETSLKFVENYNFTKYNHTVDFKPHEHLTDDIFKNYMLYSILNDEQKGIFNAW